jgi:hypothetical protein
MMPRILGLGSQPRNAGESACGSVAAEDAMKISIDPVIAGRIDAAWKQLTPDQQAQVMPQIMTAHQQAVSVSRTRKAPAGAAATHNLLLAHSVMTDDADGVINSLEAGIVVDVGADGTIWGTGKYEDLDPGWLEALADFLESLLPIIGGKAPFSTTPQTIQVPDTVQIALLGDWGTGNWRTVSNPAPSTRVGAQVTPLKPDLSIHMGDVYYAGTSDEEKYELVNIWPGGSIGSLALNSNHEMYSGGKPYFQAIAKAPFAMQRGCSFFMLENSNWVIVALDSAYYAEASNMYLDGQLFPTNKPNAQNSFLLTQQANAQLNGKRLILLTHHNGLDETGSTTNTLWDQVMGAYPAGGGPAYWYWGHVHVAAVYKPQGPGNTLCRCLGHGGLPRGNPTELATSNAIWYENRSANDPDIPQRILDGFVMLKLDGANIQEVYYDENGGVAWQSS